MKSEQKFIILKLYVLSILFTFSSLGDTIYDNFANADWNIGVPDKGVVSFKKNELMITKRNSSYPVSKIFHLDLNKTPFMLVKIKDFNKPYNCVWIPWRKSKLPAFPEITKPGLYYANLKEHYPGKDKLNFKLELLNVGDGNTTVYEYVKFTDKLTEKDWNEIRKTRDIIPRNKTLDLKPTFISCSYYWQSKNKIKDIKVLFRKTGGKWQKALDPVWIELEKIYCGSLVMLEENSEYEIKLSSSGKILVQSSFKTWSSIVPVAKTIVLNKDNCKDGLKLNNDNSGKADGYIKYIASEGFIIKSKRHYAIDIEKANYIILEGLIIKGGSYGAVKINDSRNIRIVNCDISEWGTSGIRRYEKKADLFKKDNPSLRIRNGSGIELRRSRNCIIERCYIHDPVAVGSQAWRYAHPMGYSAITTGELQSTVLRYNDIIGSDAHRWNDGIASIGNSHYHGGLALDADVYGNMLVFANDDCIELDGRQQNVRCFYNKIEGAFSGISVQYCIVGPSYVFRNLTCNMGDEFGSLGQLLKTSSLWYWNGDNAVTYIFNNTFNGRGLIPMNKKHRVVLKNNLLSNGGTLAKASKNYERDYNFVTADKTLREVHGVSGEKPVYKDEQGAAFNTLPSCPSRNRGITIANFAPSDKVDIGAYQGTENLILPYRPIPLALDKNQLNFDLKQVPSKSQTIIVTVGGSKFNAPFKIRKNKVFDWFKVSPSSGRFKSGEKVKFIVETIPEKLKPQSINRGVFLMRLANGYSRPVSIYAKTDFKQPLKPKPQGKTVFIEAEESSSKQSCQPIKAMDVSNGKYIQLDSSIKKNFAYDFDIPRNGYYFLYFRVKLKKVTKNFYRASLKITIDNKKIKTSLSGKHENWHWTPYKQHKAKAFYFKRGHHTLNIQSGKVAPAIDLIAITQNPEAFDFR